MSEINDIKTIIKSGFSNNRFKKNSGDLTSLLFDKLPPQARDLEEVVLGGMMLNKDAVVQVIDILKPDSFYLEAHKYIYEAIFELFSKSQPVDILTVTEQLRKKGVLENIGGAYYVAQLTSRVASTANIEHHARIVAEKYILRELITTSNQIIKNAYEDTTDVFELLDAAEQNLFKIAEQNLRRSYDSMPSLVAQALKNLEHIRDHEDTVYGVPSGFVDLDRITAGWQKSDLIILAARPAMGKTAFALNLARNAALDYNKPIAVFSLEMSSLQLVNRLIASETGIGSDKLKRADLKDYEWQQLTTQLDKLSDAPIFIDDTPAINIFELRAKCRRLKMQHDVQLIVIDYLQLMSGNAEGRGGNREQEISAISRALKSIAKELSVPVIALSQLSREVEKRTTDKRPQLSDLRESGAIEQDADMVLFLYRPAYYGFTEDEQGNDVRDVTEVIIAKHRNGALDKVKLKFEPRFTRFKNADNFDSNANSESLSPINEILTLKSKMNGPNDFIVDDTVPF